MKELLREVRTLRKKLKRAEGKMEIAGTMQDMNAKIMQRLNLDLDEDAFLIRPPDER